MDQLITCPITHARMVDPVMDREGNSYERSAILEWLKTHNTSPISRKPLSVSDLIPNIGLRNIIESTYGLPPSTQQPSLFGSMSNILQSIIGLTSVRTVPIEPLTVRMSKMLDPQNMSKILTKVTVVSPDNAERKPLDLALIIDNSGSMDGEVLIGTEHTNLNTLDIVKHSVKTIIKCLGRNDRIAIIKYNTTASIICPLTYMTDSGKDESIRLLESIQPEGSTNMLSGLIKGSELLRSIDRSPDRNSIMYLFTDGQDDSPRDVIPKLRKYITDNGGHSEIINTYGFGYNSDEKLLEEITKVGRGSYSFIPDMGYVGAIFESSFANSCVTLTFNASMKIDGTVINFPIQFGQNRDFVFEGDINSCTLNYDDSSVSVNCSIIDLNDPDSEDNLNIMYHFYRQLSVRLLKSFSDTAISNVRLEEFIRLIRTSDAFNKISRLPTKVESSGLLELLNDLEGQCREAISSDSEFRRWGSRFLPSLASAHELQQCNNFKDPGVQVYGGESFLRIRLDADDIFMSIPAPTPTRRYTSAYVAPLSSASYSGQSTQYGGCFHGSAKVLMEDGSEKDASLIKRGDIVRLADNNIGEIECVYKTIIKSPIQLIQLSSGHISTAWHPYKDSDTKRWGFPIESANHTDVSSIDCDAIYSYVLTESSRDCGKGMIIGGIECATLGHGILGEDVISHDFWGTLKVINNLKMSPTYEDGIVEVSEYSTIKDPNTGITIGINL